MLIAHAFKKNLLLGIFIFCVSLSPLTAKAGLLPDCDPIPGSANQCQPTHLIELAVGIYNWLLGMGALVLVLVIIVSGLGMLTHSFFEQPEQVLQSSKYGLTRGITGFIIIACAYLIVNILLAALGLDKTTAVGALLQQYGLFQ